MTRIEELTSEIEGHNRAYWEDNSPIITDPDYDLLMIELKKLDPEHALHSYTGAPETGRRKVSHDVPMISLDKVYTAEEFNLWAKKVARGPEELFYVGPKFDGLSVDKKGGVLSTKKEDVSDKLQYINNAPAEDQRGEVVVLKSVELPAKYKTTLSAASGILTTSAQEHSNLLTFIPFTQHREECTFAELSEVNWKETMLDTMKEDYPTDGLVISLKDRDYGETLGGTSHHPHHSIAFKYGNPTGATKLIDVIWQVGKRKITPVGIVEPVEIDGYTNTRMSLHNFDETTKLKVGDEIMVQRCGKIIPQLHSVIKTFKSSKHITCPVCPACGTATVYEPPNLACPNKSCGGMLAKRLHDSLTRLGVENIGPATCSDLVSAGKRSIQQVSEMAAEAWLKIPGFAIKSAQQRVDDLSSLIGGTIEDFKVLASLNIEGVGLSMSKKICAVMTLADIEDCTDFSHIEGVGKITSDKLTDDVMGSFLILRWMKTNFVIKETKGLAGRPLVVFTGKSGVPRDEWVKIAAEKGYGFHKQVNKKVALVVTDDVNSTSTKAKAARKYGIKIISYDEFEGM